MTAGNQVGGLLLDEFDNGYAIPRDMRIIISASLALTCPSPL